MAEKQKPDLSVFGTQELFAEISSRVVGAVLILDYLPRDAKKPGTELRLMANVGTYATIGMIETCRAKLVHG